MNKSFDIAISGDYVHSFIYSGTLFLIGGDSVVRTYDWGGLIEALLSDFSDDPTERRDVKDFLIDGHQGSKRLHGSRKFQRLVEPNELKPHLRSDLRLDGWPADINVYGNRLYTAGEHGVLETKFSYIDRTLDQSKRVRLLSDRAYSISPNNANRVAIAAGHNGVFSAAPSGSNLDPKRDVQQVLEVESYDCEWMNQVLIANTDSGPYAASFRAIPAIPKGVEPSPDFWDAWNAARRSEPKSREKLEGVSEVAYAWLGGNKLFKVMADGRLSVTEMTADGQEAPRTDHVINKGSDALFSGQTVEDLIAIRSAAFGAIAEAGEALLLLSNRGAEKICTRPVSWRVFPRAKNYLNHLHVVQDDAVLIFAYIPPFNESGESETFGLDEAIS
jgi:hypothetical protein